MSQLVFHKNDITHFSFNTMDGGSDMNIHVSEEVTGGSYMNIHISEEVPGRPSV